MGWFSKKVMDRSFASAKKQLEDFLEKLRAVDSDEIALVVLLANHHRLAVKRITGIDFLHPHLVLAANPAVILKLIGEIQEMQKTGLTSYASGPMVWAHTLRSCQYLELRNTGRELWRELARGFPRLHDARINHALLTGDKLDCEGAAQIPEGLGERT